MRCGGLPPEAVRGDAVEQASAGASGGPRGWIVRPSAAWPARWPHGRRLYAQCHEPLLLSIRIMLGPRNTDANLVDEIAARVWYALVANDGELLGATRRTETHA